MQLDREPWPRTSRRWESCGRLCHRFAAALLVTLAVCVQLGAQEEAQFGVAVPLTITGGILDTGRAKADEATAASLTAGFHLLAYPELELGSHWYAYSAIQARSTPFFYDDAYSADRKIDTNLLQGFVGYARSWRKASIGLKAGKLASAFGSFPLRYDDMANPLLDQPLAYTYVKLPYAGSSENEYGNALVTLYGLPGAEADASWHRVDARFQLTNSSPANPQPLFASGEHAQWTAGAGYTIRQGFRVGMSAYRGPWLGSSLGYSWGPGASFADFPATGLGIDARWARGHWSANGEWDRFQFDVPNYTTQPVASFAYAEVKRIISPRWYAAFRANSQWNGHTAWPGWRSPGPFLPNQQAYELAVGFRLNRLQLLKVGYEAMAVHGGPVVHNNVFGVQLVTSINSLSKAFR
ncbi:MAG: hypothetical protein ACRD3D_07590 [Terriglobia bacterium]